jgi:uncharacterized protein
MRFENTFTVQAPIEEVWSALMDIERVAPAMPGAEVLERTAENAYKVGVKVKLGPMSMLYRGQVEITERDDAARKAVMHARATEARGQGTATADVHMSLEEQAQGTAATIATELALSGRAAAMGAGVISDVAGALVEEFASNLAQMLGPASAAELPGPTPVPQSAAELPGPTAAPQSATELPGPTAAPQSAAEPPGPTAAPKSAVGEAAPAGPPPAQAAGATAGGGPASSGSSFPVGRIAASVISRRLSDPRVLLAGTATLAIVFTAIGYAIGRSR